MTTEAQVTPAVQTEVEAEQSVQAGYNKVRGNTHEEIRPEVVAKTEEKPAVAETVKMEEAEVVEEPVVFAGLTEPQLKAQLAKAGEVDGLREQVGKTRDQAMGRIGQLEQVVKELRERPAGQAVKLTGAQLKRVKEQYGDLADLLAEDLSEINAPAATVKTDEALAKQLEDKYGPQLLELKQALDKSKSENLEATQRSEMRRVAEKHPDWAAERSTAEFALWKQTLPVKAQQVLVSTWDSDVLIGAFDDYKAWKAKGVKTDTTKQDSTKRLEAAITPKKSSAAPAPAVLPDEQGLSVGYNRIRKRKPLSK